MQMHFFVVFFKIICKYKIVVIERTPYQELSIYYSVKDFFKKLIIKIIIRFFIKKLTLLLLTKKLQKILKK